VRFWQYVIELEFCVLFSGRSNIVLRFVVILLIGALLGGALTYQFAPSGETVATVPAHGTDGARRAVIALGTIEPRDGVIQIGSPLLGLQIKQFHAQAGQLVKAGDLLLELDAASVEAELQLALSQQADAAQLKQTEVSLAEERVRAATLAVEQAEEGRPLELAAQTARVEVAAAKLEQSKKDIQRVENLQKLQSPLATEQQVEQQKLLSQVAATEHEAARVALKRLEQTLTFQQQTAAAELRAAKQSLELAEKGTGSEALARRVELAQLKRAQARIVAPSSGVILAIHAHPGEVVSQQPLLQMADLDHLICVAEVDAGDVPLLHPRHNARIGCRAFQDGTLQGELERVGNQLAAASLRPLDPRQPVDRNVSKVIVRIDAEEAARLVPSSDPGRRAALVGLQVEVEFPLAQPAP
jgi:HlyD family secretion protein